MQVDAVEQRAGNPRLIILPAFWRPAAAKRDIRQIAAFAGIHRRDQLDLGGIGDMGVGPRHHRPPALQRLAQRLQRAAREFRNYVADAPSSRFATSCNKNRDNLAMI
jgi:hypothetical protein